MAEFKSTNPNHQAVEKFRLTEFFRITHEEYLIFKEHSGIPQFRDTFVTEVEQFWECRECGNRFKSVGSNYTFRWRLREHVKNSHEEVWIARSLERLNAI